MKDSVPGSNSYLETAQLRLYVKYKVCLRDKMTVQTELENLGIKYRISTYGAIEFLEEITDDQFYQFKKRILRSGLYLLDEKESMVIDRIITTIVEVIHHSDVLPKLRYSDIIHSHTSLNGDSVLKIFSDVMGMSVIQFIITQKIERIKELLLYDDLPLDEITQILNYESVVKLIAQFKKYTGLTPEYFKTMKKERSKIASNKPWSSIVNELPQSVY
jgi:AraC-like DNA-binding protein